MRLIWLYLGIFLLMLYLDHKCRQNYLSHLQRFEQAIDQWLYLHAKTIHDNRENIHDYDNNTQVLFATKNNILQSPNKNYIDHYIALKADMVYLDELFATPIITTQQLEATDKLHRKAYNKRKLFYRFAILATILTLGVYRIRHKPLVT